MASPSCAMVRTCSIEKSGGRFSSASWAWNFSAISPRKPNRPGFVVGLFKTALSRRPSLSSRPRAVVSIRRSSKSSSIVPIADDARPCADATMQIVCRLCGCAERAAIPSGLIASRDGAVGRHSCPASTPVANPTSVAKATGRIGKANVISARCCLACVLPTHPDNVAQANEGCSHDQSHRQRAECGAKRDLRGRRAGRAACASWSKPAAAPVTNT